MNITSPETQAKVTADDLAEILGVGDMSPEQRKAVEDALAKAGSGGERTTKDRAARPMDTQRAARKALETQKQKRAATARRSDPGRDARTGGNPAGTGRPAMPERAGTPKSDPGRDARTGGNPAGGRSPARP